MVISMLVASLDATWGSVIKNADRISPLSSGSSHFLFCASVPYLARTSILPVSGAAQLTAYHTVSTRPFHQHTSTTYLRSRPALTQVLSHKPILQITKPRTLLKMCLGQEHIPKPEFLRTLLQVLDDGRVRRKALLHCLADLASIYGVGRNAFFFYEFLYLDALLASVVA